MRDSFRIPEDAGEFFERFFLQQFASNRDRYPRTDSPGSAVFEVVGVGSWSVKIEGGGLVVKRGKADDTMLQIGVSSDDFRAIFVKRTQQEVDSSGDLSADSRDVFKPLFVDSAKARAVAHAGNNALDTLAFHLNHDGTPRQIFITPGPFERTHPRTTITMDLKDFLGMLSGRKSPVMLFMSGRLKLHGDIFYALRMRALLS